MKQLVSKLNSLHSWESRCSVINIKPTQESGFTEICFREIPNVPAKRKLLKDYQSAFCILSM